MVEKSLPGGVQGAIRLLRAFRPQIVRERASILVAFVGVAISLVLQVLEPWPLKYIYDSIFRPGRHARATGLPFAGALSPPGVIAVAVIILVAIVVLGSGAEYFSQVYLATTASRVLARIRSRLFAHVANLSIAFHNRTKTGDVITRVTNDIDRLRDVALTAALPFATNSLALLAMLVVMFWMNRRLALVAFFAFPAFFLAMNHITSRIRNASHQQRSREGAVAATTAEAISAIRVVQAFSLQERFIGIFSIDNKRSLRAGVKTQRLTAGLERTAEVLVASATAVVLWRGTREVLTGTLSPGDLIVFVSYLRTAFKPLRQLAKYLGQMSKALASGDRVLEMLETVPEISDAADAYPAPPFIGHICFENVSFEYEPGKPALRDVTFEILPGQHVAIVGPSGSGKSTIASLILRFHDPQQGRILIDGHDIREYTLESLRTQISILLQDNAFFAVTVRENIALGAMDAGLDRVLEASRLASADEFIERMPMKYETVLGERGATISGGQRQRIAIARAAIRRGPIVIMDEPTTGLDADNEHEVTVAMNRLTRGRTRILITHNLLAVTDADRILYLAGGRIVEQGSHTELLGQGGAYAAVYHGQAKGESLGGHDVALNGARRHPQAPSADFVASRTINGG